MVKANWSGRYPCLCHGEWTLEVDGVDVSMYIPDKLKTSHMNTYGEYEEWHFGEDWDEIWESYISGLACDEWVEENEYWLNAITDDADVHKLIYYAIKAEDWRYESCGGCI